MAERAMITCSANYMETDIDCHLYGPKECSQNVCEKFHLINETIKVNNDGF